MTAVTDKLEETIAPACAVVGLVLVDVELRQHTLQVTVERADGLELDLDTVAEVARGISSILDENGDLVPVEPFELEVSSPGVERRLRRPEHFQRVIGSAIAYRTNPGVPGERRGEGTLLSADGDGITVEHSGEERHIAYAEVERAHTVFDWREALRAGTARAERQAGDVESFDDGSTDDDSTDDDSEEDRDRPLGATAGEPQPAASRSRVPTMKERQNR